MISDDKVLEMQQVALNRDRRFMRGGWPNQEIIDLCQELRDARARIAEKDARIAYLEDILSRRIRGHEWTTTTGSGFVEFKPTNLVALETK